MGDQETRRADRRLAVIFIGFGAAELVHRLRHGAQQPGRHTRSSSAE
ncbi:MAG: hypothetical protein ACXV3V_10430 [Actinomycetes bacterium]